VLKIKYYHIVFTIPSEVYSIAMQNPVKMYKILFKASSETLQELARDKKYLGGDVIITATTKDGTKLSTECKITTELFSEIKTSKTPYTDSEGNFQKILVGNANVATKSLGTFIVNSKSNGGYYLARYEASQEKK
jgi:hypothetical protein